MKTRIQANFKEKSTIIKEETPMAPSRSNEDYDDVDIDDDDDDESTSKDAKKMRTTMMTTG
jgi:hypothetical protein